VFFIIYVKHKQKVVANVEYTLNSRNVILKQNVINQYLPLLFMDSNLLPWLQNFITATSIPCFIVLPYSIIGSNCYSTMLDIQVNTCN